jgi:hypothetical protein
MNHILPLFQMSYKQAGSYLEDKQKTQQKKILASKKRFKERGLLYNKDR